MRGRWEVEYNSWGNRTRFIVFNGGVKNSSLLKSKAIIRILSAVIILGIICGLAAYFAPHGRDLVP